MAVLISSLRLSFVPRWFPRRDLNCSFGRRYSDFVWLHGRLRLSHHGAVLPPLPPKRAFNRREETFVQERMEWLNQYLRSVRSFSLLTTIATHQSAHRPLVYILFIVCISILTPHLSSARLSMNPPIHRSIDQCACVRLVYYLT